MLSNYVNIIDIVSIWIMSYMKQNTVDVCVFSFFCVLEMNKQTVNTDKLLVPASAFHQKSGYQIEKLVDK